MENDTPEILLTAKDIQEHLKLGTTTVNNLLVSGKLPSLKIGKSRRVRLVDLNTFIEELVIQEGGKS